MSLMPRKSGSLSIEIPDLDRKVKVWKVIMPKAFARGLKAGIWASVIDVQARAKDLLDGEVLTRRTGRLWRSIHPEVFERGGTVVGIVGTNVKYAAIHEFGGTIRPKKKNGLLVFSIGGDEVLASEVKMPRRPYMSRALRERSPRIKKLMAFHVMQAVKGALKSGTILPVEKRIGRSKNAN